MQRRTFLRMLGLGAFAFGTTNVAESFAGTFAGRDDGAAKGNIRLFLCGDVMTGRGIDQVLPHPSQPNIYEPYLRDARDYVTIAEQANGPIPRSVAFDYIWGDALTEFQHLDPDLRIINLETAVTTSEDYWPRKGINYRMHPLNIPCLTAANIDACVLANNHVLDWGYKGLQETLGSLEEAGIKATGAGLDHQRSQAPAIFDLPGKGRVLLFAYAHWSSGTPLKWMAENRHPGLNMLDDLSEATSDKVAKQVAKVKRPGDLVVVSIHWGGNWGYQIPSEQRRFAKRLIGHAGVDVIHGHSSHHPKGIEIYKGRPIIYGCGDFINDYEGISGHERYRGDLVLMYFLVMNPDSGELSSLTMTPLRIRRFRLNYPSNNDALWLQRTMYRECSKLNASVTDLDEGRFELAWN